MSIQRYETDAKDTDGAMADAAAISARTAQTIDFTVVKDKIVSLLQNPGKGKKCDKGLT